MIKLFKIDIDPSRIFGLDILRALAILSVVIGHGSYLLPGKYKELSVFIAIDGVSIFFVLSGFLIGGILIKLIHKNSFSFSVLKYFWVRRWFRTLPSYFLILIISCMLDILFTEGFRPHGLFKYFIFSQNLFQAHPPFFPESWSLSIEEWFYLIFPLTIFFISQFKISYKKGILYVALIVIILTTAYRYYIFSNMAINGPDDWDSILRKKVLTRMDGIMFGVIGAYISYFHESLWIKFKIQLFFIGILFLFIYQFVMPQFLVFDGLYFCVFSFTLISAGTLFLLPYLSELKTGNGFLHKPITCISLISYSMYLLNLSIVQYWIIRNIPWNRITENEYIIIISNYGIYWALVIGLSILMYKYFEIPTTSLRERFK